MRISLIYFEKKIPFDIECAVDFKWENRRFCHEALSVYFDNLQLFLGQQERTFTSSRKIFGVNKVVNIQIHSLPNFPAYASTLSAYGTQLTRKITRYPCV